MTIVELIVLILAGHRIARIIGWDSITKPWREKLLGWTDDGKKIGHAGGTGRPVPGKLATLAHCPWCLGFWISIILWVCFKQWHDATLLVASPLAISSAIGVYTTNLDA